MITNTTVNYHRFHSTVVEKYNVIGYIQGHFVRVKNEIIEKNPIWIVKENEKEILLMYVEPDVLCKLCRESYQKILDFERKHRNGQKFSWTKKDKNDKNILYIRANFNNTAIYIHQVIMDWYGHGSGTSGLSVDHINRNPLDNTMENLRIVDCKTQHDNSKGILPNTKKERRIDSRELPEEIDVKEIPKYITYNVSKYGKYNEFTREFFRIENHPLLEGTVWTSSSSKYITLKEKLQQTKNALEYLNIHNVLPEKPVRELPQYVSAYIERESYLLAWRKQNGDNVLTKKITLNDDYYNLDKETQYKELQNLNREIIKKYGTEHSILDFNEEELKSIENDKKNEMPMYVRLQEFYDGLYLVFNKKKGEERISSSAKLPPNYNINRELHLFNKKIVDKYGEEHAIRLDSFPYNETEKQIIDIPKDVYISLKCKKPYIFIKECDGTTSSMILPEKYDLQEQLELFKIPENRTKCPILDIEQVKQIFYDNGMKPNNISICFKDNKHYQLQYKIKTKEIKHDKTMTLPKIPFCINIELIKLNNIIVEKYGTEYSLLLYSS